MYHLSSIFPLLRAFSFPPLFVFRIREAVASIYRHWGKREAFGVPKLWSKGLVSLSCFAAFGKIDNYVLSSFSACSYSLRRWWSRPTSRWRTRTCCPRPCPSPRSSWPGPSTRRWQSPSRGKNHIKYSNVILNHPVCPASMIQPQWKAISFGPFAPIENPWMSLKWRMKLRVNVALISDILCTHAVIKLRRSEWFQR